MSGARSKGGGAKSGDNAADGRAGPEPPEADAAFSPTDPEAFARNLARAVEEGGRALAAYLKGRESGTAPADSIAENATEVFKTIAEVGEYWSSNPARLVEAQTRLWGNYLDIWSRALRRAIGAPAEPPEPAGDPADKRFADPQWTDNPMFDALRQLYLATSGWARELVDKADGLDPATRQKARFYIEQINNALAPTNFPFTNPEVLRETAATNAENLVRGMRMLAEDIEAGKGRLKIRQTDRTAFRVGDNLANTPGKVIAENDVCQIIQYGATTDTVLRRPLLIVPPWINKFYILDLTPEKSFIRWAIGQGHTVFVVSWVNPDRKQADKSFEQYMKEGILAALDTIESATGADKINAVGYCVGGTLLAIALAYMAATDDRRIVSATLLAAQVDFTHAGDLKIFADREQIEATERRMKETGYLEGTQMATAFNLLRSNDLIWPYVVNNYLKGKEPFPFDLLYWNSDATRMPCANHSYYLRNCYLENNLARGQITIAGVPIDLGRITVPVYNLATHDDHIAPARSVFLGSRFFGGPVSFVLAGSGHIAGVVNPPARGKYQYWTGGEPTGDFEEWLAAATEHAGSWWPQWQARIEALDNERVPKRKPGGGKLKAIEDAPGSYVMVAA